jgi:hypothetical protein
MADETPVSQDVLVSSNLIEELRLKIERLEFENDKAKLTISRQDILLGSLTIQLNEAGWQLVLQQSFGALMFKAYTALQSYRIDYRKLQSYKGWAGIDWFEGSDTQRYREAMTRFITEIDHDIDAAIRRKTNIKEVPLK